MIMPFGTYITPNRCTGFAAVFAIADSAGTMLSSIGSATAAPIPRRIVRREMAFFAMNISFLSGSSPRISPSRTALSIPALHTRRRIARPAWHDAHAERRALDDAGNDRRPAVVAL